ncbi:MAG: hypothetical protein P8179_06890 [Candidatus Thiodiazotropha sp.]
MWWCTLLHIHVPTTRVHPCTARNSPLFQGVTTPPQACHSRCSATPPVGDQVHLHRIIFRKINILISEWSGQLIF